MIERLKDTNEFGNPDEAEAARLLRMLGPAVPSLAVEQRVYANLGVQRRLAPRAMHIATVATVPVLAMAALGAALARYAYHGSGTHESTAPSSLSPPTPASPAKAEGAPHAFAPQPDRPRAQEPPARAVSDPLTLPRAELRTAPRPELSPALVVARRQNHEVSRAAAEETHPEVAAPTVALPEGTEARVAAAPPEEAALVLAGLRALRREHEPTRAGMLLARYLERFPQGVLAQEALAIAIEASLARDDRQATASLAEQYLNRFPAGRFVHLARKAADPQRP